MTAKKSKFTYMKKKYIFILLFVTHLIMGQTPTGNSSEVGITEGQLSVSLSGGANYSIPIAVPPGINGVVPQVSLVYNSQGGNGVAGYGWNISGASAITRIPRTKFHDGIIGGVNLDANDRFAFDGQRLILKSGTSYGAAGAIYETESFSNVKITSQGTSSSDPNPSFKVEYPDGSVAMYGASIDSRSITTWGITYWENPQGVRISYNYVLANLGNNNLTIEFIKYGSIGTNTAINQIQFIYAPRQRQEQSYIAGQSILMNTILKEIKTTGNSVGFRNYVLGYDATSLDYERLTTITEKSGDNLSSYNPTIFGYETTEDNLTTSLSDFSMLEYNPDKIYLPGYVPSTDGRDNRNYSRSIWGDFSSDGKSSLILYPEGGRRCSYRFYPEFDSNLSTIIGKEIFIAGKLENIFRVDSFLSGDAISGYKKKDNQAWCTVDKNLTTNATTFSLNTKSTTNSNPISQEYSISYTFPNYCYLNSTNNNRTSRPTNKEYLTGDFNGDGLTDVIVLELGVNNDYEEIVTPLNSCYPNDISYTGNSYVISGAAGKVYFVNLDKRLTQNNVILAGILDNPESFDKNWSTYDKSFRIGDVNGDGKTDIIVDRKYGIDVYSLDENNTITKIQTTEFDTYSNNYGVYPIYPKGLKNIGDYNGDGKTDWGPGFLSSGNSFVENNYSSDGGITSSPMDYNNDGKTDFFQMDTNNGLRFYGNINKNHLSYLKKEYTSLGYYGTFNDIIIPSNLKRLNKIALIDYSYSKIQYVTLSKDFNKDKLLKSITTGNGVTETITYAPLINGNGVYTASGSIENYPNIDLVNASDFQVVSKIEKQSASVYKKQLFAYAGATSNVEGLGFLGFRASMRTNWFENDAQIISSVSKFDPNLRGANVANYTYLGLVAPTIAVNTAAPNTPRKSAITINDTRTGTETILATNSIRLLPGATISPTGTNIFKAQITPDYDANGFAETNTVPPTNLISKSLSFYETSLSPTKVYKLQNTQSNTYNILENTGSETVTVYDVYNNPTESISKIRNGGVSEQTTTTSIDYQSPYTTSRPTSKTQTVTSSGDSMTSKETYGYGSGTESNLLKTIQKWGNNTSAITENNLYDAFGNITDKTISASGIKDRKTSYKYDPTGRFLIESYDIETLKTTYLYNPNGTLQSETNRYGLTTSYLYDSWFKKTTTTDYLGKTNTLAYIRQNEKTLITSTGGDDGSYSEELYDDLGRKIRSGIKDLQNNMSYKDFKYDIYDRNFSTSEPHTGTASLWNTTTYDVYGRPETVTDFKGKVMSMIYDKLTTTATDSSTATTKKATKNALGNVVQMEETPGGIIKYSYFANGNLKETDYATTKITLTQDGWGRKTSLVDPSAGTYTYEYNALGEMTKETTPNGVTTYDLDDWGKPETKTIVGLNTDSNTAYTFNAVADGKLLIKTQYTDNKDASNWITTDYFYDIKKRLEKTIETTGYGAVFTKTLTYDAWGRVATETSKAELNGKSSEKVIQNDYKNGFAYKITDTQGSNPKILWETKEINARGQLTKATLGNGIGIVNTYDSSNFGYLTNTKHTLTATATTVMELSNDFNLQRGNLNWRENSLFGNVRENFTYDNQDRLLSYPDALGNIVSQTYKEDGRIETNVLGTYNYANTQKKYQNTSVTLSTGALTYYKNRGIIALPSPTATRALTVTYNTFKSPVDIKEDGVDKLSFVYNDNNSRSVMFYGSLDDNKTLRPNRKYYSADGSMEIKQNILTGAIEFVTYLGGDGYSAPVVYKKTFDTAGNAQEQMLYLHRDYQGSIIAITNDTGAIVEKRQFDAWGAILKVQDGNNNVLNGLTILDRGYTGHEHLQSVVLINMNGRIYDPKLHRFLQPDNNIQDPFNTQNYNRYSYVLNNPLKYTDPSGEWIGFIAALLFTSYANGVNQSGGEYNPTKWNSTTWANVGLGGISFVASGVATNCANNYITDYNKPPEMGVTATSDGKGNIHPYVSQNNPFNFSVFNSSKTKRSYEGSLGQFNFNFDSYLAQISGDTQFVGVDAHNYTNTGGFLYGPLAVDVGADVYIAKGNIDTRIGTKDINFNTNLNGCVGCAEANVTTGIFVGENGKYGLYRDTNIGAYGAKGEYSLSFSLFGFKFTDTVGGSLYSAHAGRTWGGYYDNKSGILTLKGGFNFGWGVGIKEGATLEIPLLKIINFLNN